MPIMTYDAWPRVARLLGLPVDGVKSAVITFDLYEPVQAEIEMFAMPPLRPRASVWGTVAAGSAPFDEDR